MFKNYLKIAFRNLWKSKGFTLINISGLAIGMAAAILILLWIQNEMSMDRFHEKGDRIYLMYQRDKDAAGEVLLKPRTPVALTAALKQDYPEVEDATRYRDVTFLLTVGDKHLNVQGAFADSGFLNVFSYPLLKGNTKEVLNNSYSIVITEKLAKKFFGDEDAMGKTIRIDSVNNCTVTGVLKDLPNNTQMNFEYILPWAYETKLGWWEDKNWSLNVLMTFVLLKKNASQTAFDQKIKTIAIDHTKNTSNPVMNEIFTQPLNRSYLYGKSENGKLVGGQIHTVVMFGIIAAFILLIACINFMNLGTARSEKRAKEVGIRKVVGAEKKSLVLQFLSESILVSMIAFIVALLLVQISLDWFNNLTGKQLFVSYNNPWFWLFALGFVLFTGCVAGSYPAFFLSSFNPVKVLKGTFKKIDALVTPRKILVITQFTFAIFLIIATIVVVKQIKYGLNRNAGYNQNNLIYTFTQGEVDKHYLSIRNELLNSGSVVAVTKSISPITKAWVRGDGYQWQGSTKNDEKIEFTWFGTDAYFAKTIGINLLGGRDIDIYNYPADSTSILINESAVKAMHLNNPIGTVLHANGENNVHWQVVGVVKDFIMDAPFEAQIKPMIIFGPGQAFSQVLHIKMNPANSTTSNLEKIKGIFKKYNPQYPFEYTFVDEDYAQKFTSIQRQSKLAMLFAGLTIFISCLGLFALSAYMAENRIKEIGVRKVLGASVLGISALLSKDFLKLILIAFLVAVPLAWWLMNKWLSMYSYHISIEWWVFLLTGVISVFIAIATISFQAIKAALANPIKSLRTE